MILSKNLTECWLVDFGFKVPQQVWSYGDGTSVYHLTNQRSLQSNLLHQSDKASDLCHEEFFQQNVQVHINKKENLKLRETLFRVIKKMGSKM